MIHYEPIGRRATLCASQNNLLTSASSDISFSFHLLIVELCLVKSSGSYQLFQSRLISSQLFSPHMSKISNLYSHSSNCSWKQKFSPAVLPTECLQFQRQKPRQKQHEHYHFIQSMKISGVWLKLLPCNFRMTLDLNVWNRFSSNSYHHISRAAVLGGSHVRKPSCLQKSQRNWAALCLLHREVFKLRASTL